MASGTIAGARRTGGSQMEGTARLPEGDLTWDPGDPAPNVTYFRLLAGGPAAGDI